MSEPISQSGNQVTRPLYWADIDRHDTAGRAERVVRLLNSGRTESSVATCLSIPLSTVYYILRHDGYQVHPEVVRTFRRLRDHRVSEEIYKAWSAISAVMKEAIRG